MSGTICPPRIHLLVDLDPLLSLQPDPYEFVELHLEHLQDDSDVDEELQLGQDHPQSLQHDTSEVIEHGISMGLA